jgi:two-component system, LytTR family, response regulator
MLNCIIVDDEPKAIKALKQLVAACSALNLVLATTQPTEVLDRIDQQPIDLAFLDIQMPGMNGLELAKALRGRCKVIFTTGYSEFVTDALDIDVQAVDYLLKPIGLSRLIRAVQKVIDSMGNQATHLTNPPTSGPYILAQDYIFVRVGYKGEMKRIMLGSIDYVEAKEKYLTIYYSGEKTMALMSLKEMDKDLPAQYFMRVHRSYIVSLPKIIAIKSNHLQLEDVDMEIPIGDTYKAAFMEVMKNKLLG